MNEVGEQAWHSAANPSGTGGDLVGPRRGVRWRMGWAVFLVGLASLLGAAVARIGGSNGDDDGSAGSASRATAPEAGSGPPTTKGTTDFSRPAAGASAECVQGGPGGPWFRLAALDNFDEPGPDEGVWYLYDSPGNAGFGLRRPAAITTRNGLLEIRAQMIDGVLVSGGMAHALSQTYGRWEFRVRTDPDPSRATSGVVLTWPTSGNWPVDGENNIYETLTRPDRQPYFSFVHYGVDNSQEVLEHDADGSRWQVMAMEWTPDRIAIYRNGIPAGEVTKPEAIPHGPHHMTVQLDAWADTMGDPVTLQVDWVRVYDWVEDGRC